MKIGPEMASMGLTLQQDVINQARYPILLEQSRHKSFTMVQDTDFEFGLRTVIEGLRAQLTSAKPAKPRTPPAKATSARKRPAKKS